MPTTSNFGWTTPADTDLVKDGALAIRTLGNGIDTSMAQLKGGTTGQVLSKTNGTDMAFTWVTQDDANAIQNAIVDAKGDLITATAADTPSRLAVGTNGQYLVADSAQTTGLKWQGVVGCRLERSGVQSIPTGTDTTVTWDTEVWDTNGFHSTVSNTDRITIPTGLGGYYRIDQILSFAVNSTGTRSWYLYKNASTIAVFANVPTNSGGLNTMSQSTVLNLVAGDYLWIQVNQNSGGNLNLSGANYATSFTATYLGV